MVKRKITQFIIIVFVLFLLINTKSYAMPSKWATQTVNEAISYGLVPKELQDNYQSNITREQFSKLVVKTLETYSKKPIDDILIENEIYATKDPFKDTKSLEVNAAYKLGIVRGVSEGIFSPSALLTREQAAVMLKNIVLLLGGIEEKQTINFVDQDSIGKWAIDYVNYVTKTNIITGIAVGKRFAFQPKSNYTIEQAIATIDRIYNQIDNLKDINLIPISECIEDVYDTSNNIFTLSNVTNIDMSEHDFTDINEVSVMMKEKDYTVKSDEELEEEGKYRANVNENINDNNFEVIVGKSKLVVEGYFINLCTAEVDGNKNQKEILLFYKNLKNNNMLKVLEYDGTDVLGEVVTVRNKNYIGEEIKIDEKGKIFDAYDTDKEGNIYGYQNLNLHFQFGRIIETNRNYDYVLPTDVYTLNVFENGNEKELTNKEIMAYGLKKGNTIRIVNVDKAKSTMTIITSNGQTLLIEI